MDLPSELKIRAMKEIDFTMSIHNWLKVADALEAQAAGERSFEQQMADQIRFGCAEELGHTTTE